MTFLQQVMADVDEEFRRLNDEVDHLYYDIRVDWANETDLSRLRAVALAITDRLLHDTTLSESKRMDLVILQGKVRDMTVVSRDEESMRILWPYEQNSAGYALRGSLLMDQARDWLVSWIVTNVANSPGAETMNLVYAGEVDKWIQRAFRSEKDRWDQSRLKQRLDSTVSEEFIWRNWPHDDATTARMLMYLRSHANGDATALKTCKPVIDALIDERDGVQLRRVFVKPDDTFAYYATFGALVIQWVDEATTGTLSQAVYENRTWRLSFIATEILPYPALWKEIPLLEMLGIVKMFTAVAEYDPEHQSKQWYQDFATAIARLPPYDFIVSIRYVSRIWDSDDRPLSDLMNNNTRSPALVDYFTNAPRSRHVQFLYRGIKQELVPEVTYPISTTLDLETAVWFMQRADMPQPNCSLMVIRVPIGTPMLCLIPHSRESEVVLASYARLVRVTEERPLNAFVRQWLAYRTPHALHKDRTLQRRLIYVDYRFERHGISTRAVNRVPGQPLFVPEEFE